jgi:iron complex transport system ATP-binding protein
MVTAVEWRGVGVALGGRPVLAGVDLAVAPGEWLAVVGPNGAGKTTLLRATARLVPSSGEVLVGGDPIGALGRRALARRVALVPQTPLVPPGMSASAYVLLGRTAHLAPFAGEGPADLAAATDALARLDLLPFAERPMTELSGGERQRVVLARLLAQGAPVALLDEPTSSLDIGQEQRALGLIDELRRTEGLTVVATMHDLSVAGQYADRIAILVGGRMVAVGTPAELLVPDVLHAHYGADVSVLDGPDGPVVVARRSRS